MTAASALYVGAVVHRRSAPRTHVLRYRAFWLLIDLDELPRLAARLRLFSHNAGNLFSLHDSDHGDGSATPLRQQVERHLAAAGIDIAGGAIRLLCMPRTFGYGFNPLSAYFCHRRDGALAAMLYQVHNTFGERHSYLIPVESSSGVVRQRCDKAFFVSPFLDMRMRYDFKVVPPADRVVIAIRGSNAAGPVITASLAAERRELTDRALLLAFLRVPAVTAKVMVAIHWEALRLWLKGVRLRRRPPAPDALVTITPSSLRNTK